MQVLLHTDNHLTANEALTQHVEDEVHAALERFEAQITRVEVHVNDANGPKSGDRDKRCLMEARLSGHQPVAASDAAETFDEAIRGAAEKLEHALSKLLDKLSHHKGRTSFGGDQTI